MTTHSFLSRLGTDDLLRTAARLAFDEATYPTGRPGREVALFEALVELRERGVFGSEDLGGVLSTLRAIYAVGNALARFGGLGIC